MIDPTRDEWLAVRGRLMVADHPADADAWTEAAIGPCPPEPAPKDWYGGRLVLSAVKVGGRRSVVIYFDDPSREDPYVLTLDEAGTMAGALDEYARYCCEQEAAKEPEPCGRGWPLCQRPKGHAGVCKAGGA